MTSFACPRRVPDTLPLDARVHPGFGSAVVYCQSRRLYLSEDATLRDAENYARANGREFDWRLSIDGPLARMTYQRQAAGVWVLIERSEGFA
jgi:hypothetical protein